MAFFLSLLKSISCFCLDGKRSFQQLKKQAHTNKRRTTEIAFPSTLFHLRSPTGGFKPLTAVEKGIPALSSPGGVWECLCSRRAGRFGWWPEPLAVCPQTWAQGPQSSRLRADPGQRAPCSAHRAAWAAGRMGRCRIRLLLESPQREPAR